MPFQRALRFPQLRNLPDQESSVTQGSWQHVQHLGDQGEIGRRASLSIKYEFILNQLPRYSPSRCIRWECFVSLPNLTFNLVGVGG